MKNRHSERDDRGRFKPKNPSAKVAERPATPEESFPAPIDVVIAFDTTGSMSSYIASVRKHVKDLIGELFKNTPNLRMKIVAFGDYCDMESATVFGRAYQETSLTNDENELIDFVNKAKDTGGGDGPEFYELVIKKITEETPWREGKKSVLLIADATPHEVGYSYRRIVMNAQIDWREEAKKAASKNIQFDTLRIDRGTKWYEELSKITNVICAEFSNSGKVSEVIKAATYARGSVDSFYSSMKEAEKSGDGELIGMYKSMSKLID
jgi:hypothetical protein